MSDKIHLKVITHQKIVFEDDIDELYVQATDGRLGILKNHIPILATLNVGVARVVKGKESQCLAVMGGILKFANNEAIILTDVAELECDIDVARAKHAKERALARMQAKDENLDMVRVQVALSKAIARINAVDKKY
jgi:F-type H+-transporting ATPase subunit epsilon